jgi:predicted DNA-binding transcriptional regulator YafY
MSSKLERIRWIDNEIRAHRYPNAHRVQEHFRLQSARMAYNDRKYMIECLDAPIKYDWDRGGWYYTDPNYFLPSIILTRDEILAFFLGEELFKRYLGTAFEEPLRSALVKIKQYLPEYVTYNLQAETSTFAFTTGATIQVSADLMADLDQAIHSKQQVEMVYYSASSGETSRRIVDPYYLHNIRGDWYLIAYCHRRGEFRDFHVGRIREWKVLYSTFQKRPGFSLEGYLQEHFLAERGEEPVDIVIKFDDYEARWIRERQWHPSQQIEELPSGGLILRLRVGGVDEVKRWIMGYGVHAEVLEPESLRAQFKDEAGKMRKIYEEKAE